MNMGVHVLAAQYARFMSSDREFVDSFVDAFSAAGPARARSMMGEWMIYIDDKVVALVGDNQLFLKPAGQITELLRTRELASHYPGAKEHYVIPKSDWADADYLADLARATADAFPAPKPKKRKA